jgi:hypothetical protein
MPVIPMPDESNIPTITFLWIPQGTRFRSFHHIAKVRDGVQTPSRLGGCASVKIQWLELQTQDFIFAENAISAIINFYIGSNQSNEYQ